MENFIYMALAVFALMFVRVELKLMAFKSLVADLSNRVTNINTSLVRIESKIDQLLKQKVTIAGEKPNELQ